ncbi:hypothetical protein KRX54_02240 [Actinomycetaceae bacterium TAE3-ERU4]|nr:hypothetical protein [Actinomycetaceae bacterium TAE3-ERU4]
MRWLDAAALVAYFVIVIAAGVIGARRANSRDDYIVAGRKLNFPMFFACIAAMAVGGAVTVGGAARGYEVGISGWWIGGSLGLGFILLGMVVSSKLNALRAVSITDVVYQNYGMAARIMSAILTIIYTLALSTVQIIAMGAIMSGLLGWSMFVSCLVSGSVVAFYTVIGGMWSVTLTDIVQFIVKTLGVIIIAPPLILLNSHVGGFSGIWSSVPSSHWDIGALGFNGSLYWILLYVPGLFIGQDIWQRIFTAKNKKIARSGTIGAGIYSLIYGFCAVFIGLAVKASHTQLDDPQQAFAVGVLKFLPDGISGLLLAAALAASMSVASGTILACSTIVHEELLAIPAIRERFALVDNSETSKPTLDRFLALAVGAVALILSISIGDIFIALDLSYTFLSGCVFVPVIAIFVNRKVNHKAGLISLFSSALVVTVITILGFTGALPAIVGQEWAKDWGIGGPYPILAGMIVGALSYIIVYLLDCKNAVLSTATEATGRI